MGTVNLHLFGASGYVPHTAGDRLLAVLPNASRLGTSPETVADGSRPAVHWPVLYEKRAAGGLLGISMPKNFLGARLTFDFGANPPALDLSAIAPLIAQGWLQTATQALTTNPGDGVAGQILVTAGTVSEFTGIGPCAASWSPAPFAGSIGPVVKGLLVQVNGATQFVARATSWLGAAPIDLVQRSLGASDVVHFFAGNLCPEDVLEWTHDADNGRAVDDDFKWVLGLSTNPAVAPYLTAHGQLPAPEVKGGPVEATDAVAQAFLALSGGGGIAGCECRGCVDGSRAF